MASLVVLSELEALLKVPENTLVDDEYTRIITDAASDLVRTTAGQPNWQLTVSGPDDVLAPTRARFIALWLAKRAWEDKGNLVRRTAGPISQTFSEEGIRGLELTESEIDWLEGQQPGGSSGTFILKHYGTTASRRPFGDETPDGYSFAAGDLDFAHGMTMSGPARADNW